MPCAKWAEETRQECAEYKDEGYNKCSEYQDQGYNKCSSWDDQCCDWWPCSWGCKLITWVCMGWYWVSNLVCVAWYWVSNVVCVAWTYITQAVCVLWDFAVTVVAAIIETLESILGWVLSFLALIVELILSIPIIGRLIKWIWNVVLTIVWGVAGVIDFVLSVVGVRPEKKLRVCTVMLCDERGTPVGAKADVVTHLQNSIDIYRDEANVRVIRSAPFQYDSGFADKEQAGEDWVCVYDRPSPKNILNVGCDSPAASEDLGTPGAQFEILASTQCCFYSNFRRLIGYGAPVVVFVVRDVKGKLGCSLGPLTDYVTVEGGNPICIPHELGHACNLWHVDISDNLMNHDCGRRKLKWWQVAILRNSRHVTYF